jgi:hypothetical protein
MSCSLCFVTISKFVLSFRATHNVFTRTDLTGKIIALHNSVANIWKSVTVMAFFKSYRGANKSLARPTSICILFDGENISFDASLFVCINGNNIPPIMIISRLYENQSLLSLQLVSFLVGLRTYHHPCTNVVLVLMGQERHETLQFV